MENNEHIPFFERHTEWTGNKIGDAGATSLSDALRSNTALTELNLRGDDKRSNTQKAFTEKPLFSVRIKSTANNIGNTGAALLSEALKSNIALTKLDLGREHKETTHKQFPSTINF